MEKIIEALPLCPIFKNLTEHDIIAVLHNIQYVKQTFEKNQIIFRTGDTAHHIAMIITGSIEIRKYLSSGNRLSIFQRTKGEMLGGSIMFSSNPQYPCEVVAKEKSELLFIDKPSVLQVLLKDATIASNIMRISADRIMQFERRLELFSFFPFRKKSLFHCYMILSV